MPANARLILDTGCGLGSGTRRIASRRPDACVLAGNISLWQLSKAKACGVARTVAMDAVRLPVRSGTLDAVVAIESAQHFDTRAAFLAEACPGPRPNGVLSMADMLFRDTDAIDPWLSPRANRLTSLTEYETRASRQRVHADCGRGRHRRYLAAILPRHAQRLRRRWQDGRRHRGGGFALPARERPALRTVSRTATSLRSMFDILSVTREVYFYQTAILLTRKSS